MKETIGNTRTSERSIDNISGRYAVVTGRGGAVVNQTIEGRGHLCRVVGTATLIILNFNSNLNCSCDDYVTVMV
jgi:hypothetical protein